MRTPLDAAVTISRLDYQLMNDSIAVDDNRRRRWGRRVGLADRRPTSGRPYISPVFRCWSREWRAANGADVLWHNNLERTAGAQMTRRSSSVVSSWIPAVGTVRRYRRPCRLALPCTTPHLLTHTSGVPHGLGFPS